MPKHADLWQDNRKNKGTGYFSLGFSLCSEEGVSWLFITWNITLLFVLE